MVRIKLKGKKLIIDDAIEVLLEDMSDTDLFEFLIYLVNHFMAA